MKFYASLSVSLRPSLDPWSYGVFLDLCCLPGDSSSLYSINNKPFFEIFFPTKLCQLFEYPPPLPFATGSDLVSLLFQSPYAESSGFSLRIRRHCFCLLFILLSFSNFFHLFAIRRSSIRLDRLLSSFETAVPRLPSFTQPL